MGWISNAFLSIFMGKSARDKLKTRAGSAEAATADPNGGGAFDREEAIKRMQAQIKGAQGGQAGGGSAQDRAALIRQAMEVRRAKQAVLDDLSDEQREKLVALAMKQLLNETPSDGKR